METSFSQGGYGERKCLDSYFIVNNEK